MHEQPSERRVLNDSERVFRDMVSALRPHVSPETGEVDLKSADVPVSEVYTMYSSRLTPEDLGAAFTDALLAIQETRERPGEFYMTEIEGPGLANEETSVEELQIGTIGSEFIPPRVSGYGEVAVMNTVLRFAEYAGGVAAGAIAGKYIWDKLVSGKLHHVREG